MGDKQSWRILLLCWGLPATVVRSQMTSYSLSPLSCMALGGCWMFFMVPKICCPLFPSMSSLHGS